MKNNVEGPELLGRQNAAEEDDSDHQDDVELDDSDHQDDVELDDSDHQDDVELDEVAGDADEEIRHYNVKLSNIKMTKLILKVIFILSK